MKSRKLALVAALVLTLTGLIAAKANKFTPLVAGGRTIAGPGTTTWVTGPGPTPFVTGTAGYAGCLTALNVGSTPLEIALLGNGDDSVGQLDPGETRVLCHGDMGAATVSCLGTGDDPCTVHWRLDLAD